VTIHFQADAVIAFFLALVRGTAFLVACPPFATQAIPMVGKTAIAGGLAFAAIGPLSHDPMPLSTAALVGALVLQIGVGALIGFVVQMYVSAISSAGALIDHFSGLNLPPAIDPMSLEQLPVIGQLFQWMATVLLFSTGAVGILAEGFVRSFGVIGTTLPARDVAMLPSALGQDLVGFFAASTEVAAPLIAVLVVAQILLGLLAKAAPQTNVFSLGFPFQILLVLFTLGLAIVALPSDVANLVQRGLGQLFGG